jgi:hypothetical protein
LKPLLRGSASDEEIATYIQECFRRKPAGVAYMPLFKKLAFERVKPRAMYAIGG